jgi:N,N-dimethylformamidase
MTDISATPVLQRVFGYTDRLSARSGESLSLHVSCPEDDAFDVSIVRLQHGWDGAAGPGFVETPVPSDVDGSYPGHHYACVPGSYVEVPDPESRLAEPIGLSLSVAVFPTLPSKAHTGTVGAYRISNASNMLTGSRQAILGNLDTELCGGWALTLDEGRPTFTVAANGVLHATRLEHELVAQHWYQLSVTVSPDGTNIVLQCTPLGHLSDLHLPAASNLQPEVARTNVDGECTPSALPFRIGALTARDGHRLTPSSGFNGKIGGVTVDRHIDGVLVPVARWHFGRSERSDGLLLSRVIDESPNRLNGQCRNGPMRAVTGPRFGGLARDFRLAPDEYDAIFFHDDDITDTDWPAALTLTVPETMESGVYAFRLTVEGMDHHVPFFVGPAKARRRDVAVLFPTGTYLAYANDRIAFEADSMEVLLGHTPVVHAEDLVLQNNPEFGRSCYEAHNDGSGVVFSSCRRPLITMQPRYCYSFASEGPWALAADLCITHWLETVDCEFDAITDEDLDREGYELIADYRVVITGSHPEYVTRTELDALEELTANGGRLMYLGGNGFYATTSYDPENPHVVEVRRASGGTRPHQTPFAEQRHATSGEQAGLWRDKGKAPERLVGVGMSAQGFDRSTHYERLQDSFDPRAEFIFDRIGDTELIGDFGIIGGGAAGSEIDFYNPTLGTPPNTLVLATSGPLTDVYQLAMEELYETLPGIGGSEHPSVRSDLVYGSVHGGGGFFSVGSIAWTGSLSHNDYDNNVARLTTNVLRRFRDPEPLK